MLRKVPLIVILGSTGTGKTKLSIELAERFCGEIISADSMQVYANLDIATAKASREEQSRAKHHLLDVATPAEPFSVLQFRNAALPIIEKLMAQNKCPIVVGGTNYYIESLLWDTLIGPMDLDKERSPTNVSSLTSDETSSETYLSDKQMLAMTSELLHEHLKTIDAKSANRIHPNNKRKIMRAIEVYQETGQTLTEKFEEQRKLPGANRLGGPLRYPHTILFWLRCQQDVLDARLDKRVDSMLEQGLLREIRAFHDQHKLPDNKPTSSSSSSLVGQTQTGKLLEQLNEDDYSKGVLQTIGFKEFVPYLRQFDAANDEQIEQYLQQNQYKMPSEEQFKLLRKANRKQIEPQDAALKSIPNGLELLNSCLNELKLVTRRYSKKQIKWVNNRFLASRDRQVPDLYALDTSDVSLWHEKVLRPASQIIECHQNNAVCEIEPLAKLQHPGEGLDEEISNYCSVCERHFVGEFQWQLHMKSNKHKRRKESLRKKQKLAAEMKTEKLKQPNNESPTFI